jgi:hypothetical protein
MAEEKKVVDPALASYF